MAGLGVLGAASPDSVAVAAISLLFVNLPLGIYLTSVLDRLLQSARTRLVAPALLGPVLGLVFAIEVVFAALPEQHGIRHEYLAGVPAALATAIAQVVALGIVVLASAVVANAIGGWATRFRLRRLRESMVSQGRSIAFPA